MYRLETTLNQDGTLTLNNLPYRAGDVVEVIIVDRSPLSTGANRYPLRGQPLQYSQPTAPVAEQEWNALL